MQKAISRKTLNKSAIQNTTPLYINFPYSKLAPLSPPLTPTPASLSLSRLPDTTFAAGSAFHINIDSLSLSLSNTQTHTERS